MNFYQTQKREKRNAAIIRGIKITFWCIVVAAMIGKVGSVEFADKLALGIL